MHNETAIEAPLAPRECRYLTRTAAVVIAAIVWLPWSAAAEEATMLRVFLQDGTTVVSYGEYARVGDRVVFSVPIGALNANPKLHVVNLPAAVVDWPNTTRYAESARYARYAATRGEADYTALTAEVARVLNQIVVTENAGRRLDLAVQARKTLSAWPQMHYGYRASDVQQILGLLDEAISELRAAAGETSFDLELVAAVEPPALMPVLETPTPAESIAQALTVARLTDVPVERLQLLNTIVSAIDDTTNALPAAWVNTTRRQVVSMIRQETRTEREYARLSMTALRQAVAASARADVRNVEGIIATVRSRDAELGHKRPEQINALIASVQERLDAARRLRLVRDKWLERIGAYRAYQASIAPTVRTLLRAQQALDDIKRLAGPTAVALVDLSERLQDSIRRLSVVPIPDELKASHALLVSAVNLAGGAVRSRRQAVGSGDWQTAWEASSAAAGSMMLFARARADLEAVIKLPQLR